MKPIERIPIKESLSELNALYKSSPDFLRPRIEMLMILIKEPVITKPQLARRLNVVYNSISKWHELYKQGGLSKLLEVNRGKYKSPDRRTMGFAPEIYAAIEKRHKEQPFQSYVELHAWIRNNFLPGIKYATLIKYLDIHFGETLQIKKMLRVTVKESTQELERILSRSLPRVKPRIQMLMELGCGKKVTRKELATSLQVSYGSIIKWLEIYSQGGIQELQNYKLANVITQDVLNYIEERFSQNKFRNFSELYKEISGSYLPGIKYYTLHRYVHRHFAKELDGAKALHFPIKETTDELQSLFSKCSTDRKQRIRLLMLLKANPGYTKIELARLTGVAVGSIHRWCNLYKQSGINGILEMKVRGRRRLALPEETHKMIGKKLKQNPEITITELHVWLKAVYHEDMTYNKLYRYVRNHFAELLKTNLSDGMMNNVVFNRVA